MTLVALVLPAVVGGVLLAALLMRVNRRASSGLVAPSELEPMSPDLINMAHIRVAGLGGLGMLGATVVTAISLPQIGAALVASVGLGAGVAAGLIAYRRRSAAAGDGGPDRRLPTMLALDDRRARAGAPATRDFPGAPAVVVTA